MCADIFEKAFDRYLTMFWAQHEKKHVITVNYECFYFVSGT